MRSQSTIGNGKQLSGGFSKSAGLVVYYIAAAWEHIHEKRGIIQPLGNAERASWAVHVLGHHYPERTYETMKMYAQEGVTTQQMEALEVPVVDDLGKLEVAHNLGLDWYV
ncbi:hypothetical protein ACIGCM_20245 [Pseudomonas sp. NPDC078700]|uniref:hypothetical protein n=1 Tax=Pseudomonas sp. NPDC078700 TaxID=3364424 RepID=UPI0037C7E477